MKTRKFLLSIIIVFLALIGCNLGNRKTNNTNIPLNPTPTEEISYMLTSTEEEAYPLFPTETLVPESTLLPATRDRYIEMLMKTNGCKFPCFWGITPGKTEKDQTIGIFTSLGSKITNTRKNIYEIGIDWRKGFNIDITVYTQNNLIQKIGIGFTGDNYANNIGQYSIRNILSSNGPPDEAWINLLIYGEIEMPIYTGVQMILLYKNIPMVISYDLSAEKMDDYYRFCPLHAAKYNPSFLDTRGGMGMVISTEKDETPEEIVSPHGQFLGEKTVEEAVEMSLGSLSAKIIDEVDPCFDTKISVWQRSN